jgi:intein-encoded DNA endonuclease-like protein
MKTKIEILEENKEFIFDRFRANESAASIAKDYSCSDVYMCSFLKKHGIMQSAEKIDIYKCEIFRLHYEGYTAYQIEKLLPVSKNSISRFLAKEGISISHRQRKREDKLTDHKEEIIRRYEVGEGCQLIAKTYGCNENSIRRRLMAWGVKRRPLRHYAYSFNEHFFDKVDTEEKAYILGFLMADGSNDNKKGVIRLSITDHDILHVIANKIGWTGPISKIKRLGKMEKDQYLLVIGCRHFSDRLQSLGCIPGKSYTAQFQTEEQVPCHLHRHLIRGWMDGDGTITVKPGGLHWHMRIVGTGEACKGISACIDKHLGFSGSVFPVHKGAKHTTWGFTVSGKNKLKMFLDWLYSDATIYLQRKYDKYQEFLATTLKPLTIEDYDEPVIRFTGVSSLDE